MTKINFEIIIGTYEEYLLGFYFVAKENELIQSFAAHDHSSSIRCLAYVGDFLSTGAADDRIFIYDLKTRKEHCMLTHHEATITCLQFTDSHSHLVSGSSDGVLSISRVGSWQQERVWDKAHKGAAILDVAVHSTGKLALSLGADYTLRTWNLIKGRQAYVINLNSKCKDAKSLERIIWAPDGVKFVLYGGKYTEIWSIDSGGVLKVFEHHSKVSSCIWITKSSLIVGYEDGQIAMIHLDTIKKTIHKAHSGRVKGIALYSDWIVTVSSTGGIKVWTRELVEVASHDTGCRLTCLCIVPPIKVKKEIKSKEVSNIRPSIEGNKINSIVKSRSVVVEIEESEDENMENNNSSNGLSVGDSKNSDKRKRALDTVHTNNRGMNKKQKIQEHIDKSNQNMIRAKNKNKQNSSNAHKTKLNKQGIKNKNSKKNKKMR